MTQVVLALVGGVVSALAFPRFGPGLLIIPGLVLFLHALRRVESRLGGFVVGFAYGAGLISGLMWWSLELGAIALVPLVVVQALFYAGLGWWLAGFRLETPGVWFLTVVALWSLMEMARYHLPFSGLEWGGAGYALSELSPVRLGSTVVGTSGWTVIVVAVSAVLALAWSERILAGWFLAVAAFPAVVIGVAVAAENLNAYDGPGPVSVAIVQGSTPCPYENCPPDERLRTYQQHLDLTGTIEPGSTDLVVWAEGSSGSSNADPVQNTEIGLAIGEEAQRIGAWMLVGSDRPISDEEWINANVVFNDDGEIVGEYRKQQGVPFGEYIPFRPLFEWIPDLDQVPRDMIPGEGPVVFGAPFADIGSVISFEGSFARFALQHVRAGADLMVVATNEGSYGTTPVSDQLIGMTRMRAAELGVPVVHSAVTGKSVVIDRTGGFSSEISGLATEEVVSGEVDFGPRSIYSYLGDWLMYLAIAVGFVMAVRVQGLLVSRNRSSP